MQTSDLMNMLIFHIAFEVTFGSEIRE